MAWTFLVVSEGSQKPLMDTSHPSLTVKSSHTLEGFFYLGWRMETCHAPLSGGMSLHSVEPTYRSSPTSSTAVSPAKTLASQDAELVWKDSEAAYFSRSCAWPKKSSPHSYSLRTSQHSEHAASILLSGNYPISGMTVAGVLYPLQTWERIIKEKGGFYWRTPQAANESQGPKSPENFQRCMTEKNAPQITLTDQVRMWPTPRAEKVGGYSSSDFSPTLEQAVMWPTPRACDGDKGIRSPAGMARERERRKNGVDLPTAAGGRLNPTWVEWLMGYPSGWTVLEDWAMLWCRPKRGKRLND